MNYIEKKQDLICVVSDFLQKKIDIDALNEYAWAQIDDFLLHHEPEIKQDENSNLFWYVIWQIQHLANKDHWEDGTLERELKKMLEYLVGKTNIPTNLRGIPPTQQK